MGYRRMEPDTFYSIYRRWHAGQSLSAISRDEGKCRKTLRTYFQQLAARGASKERSLLSREEFMPIAARIIPSSSRKRPADEVLGEHEAEIFALISSAEPVKPKTAHRIITQKYGLKVSYSSFKRFYRERRPARQEPAQTIRIELPPGREIQVDYGYVGMFRDPRSGKNRKVHAFTGVLAHSRLPFVQFVYSQTQQSFVDSFVDMFEYYGGVPQFVTIDNLKSGVLKPDLYEPRLNPAFLEMAEYYNTFVNPARVRTPTDKGKVERFIPVARELFRELKNVHSDVGLTELNRRAQVHCREEYGGRPHGTTNIAPAVAFEQERETLTRLPAERFEVPVWKEAKVHPDQFIQFEKKTYSLPPEYRGKTLMVRKSGGIVHIYHNHVLIRQYAIPKGYREYEPADFPAHAAAMMDGSAPKVVIRQARVLGQAAREYIESVLQPHAYLNLRRAQGLLGIMEAYRHVTGFADVCAQAQHLKIVRPNRLKRLFEQEVAQFRMELTVPRSATGEAMTRDVHYYLN